MTGRWPPAAAFFGLHVDAGDFHSVRRVWLRLPVARLTCRWCALDRTAVGVADVVDLTHRITPTHAQECPGPPGGEA